jgi:hypothetical protein
MAVMKSQVGITAPVVTVTSNGKSGLSYGRTTGSKPSASARREGNRVLSGREEMIEVHWAGLFEVIPGSRHVPQDCGILIVERHKIPPARFTAIS